MQIAKMDDGLSVRIPDDVVEALGLKEGDDVDVHALDGGGLAVVTERQRRTAALKRLRALAVPFPADYKFDREEANAR